jgi:ABC-type transport system involved in multi-copper enzyme maturation permease subunit
MIYLKSLLVGIVAAIVTSALWIVVTFVIPLVAPFLLAGSSGDYSGGSVAVIGSFSILLAALVGFAAGFGWMLRRARKLIPQR